ncbi:MAG: hypothetical protein NC412_02240 [Roseburia sp.]|nr:hypothetical protein [Roseburia sp.]MCM1278061.1 hypothetical protein [Robinsoniella sp.]
MKLKIGEREKNIILGLIGIAIPLLVYFFVFVSLNEQTDVLVAENQSLAQEVAYLQELMDNKEFYLAETDRMNAEMEEIKAQFPSELHPEDEIYYAYNMENKYDVLATAIDMPVAEAVAIAQPVTAEAQPEVVDDGTGEAAEGTENAGAAQAEQAAPVASAATTIALYRAPITFNFKLTYTAAKEWIKEILTDRENKKSIDNVTLSYDESTGNLTGSIIVNMFSLTGTDRIYEAPSIQGIGIGTDNLFKSSETLNVGRENNTFDANAESTETENNDQSEDEQ